MICEECGTDDDDVITIARGEDVSFESMCRYLPKITKLLGIQNKAINIIPIVFSERNGEGTNILVLLDEDGTHIIKLDLLDKEMVNDLVH